MLSGMAARRITVQHMRPYRLGDDELDKRLLELVRDATNGHEGHEHDEDLIAEIDETLAEKESELMEI